MAVNTPRLGLRSGYPAAPSGAAIRSRVSEVPCESGVDTGEKTLLASVKQRFIDKVVESTIVQNKNKN
jgi:hypothetical protein